LADRVALDAIAVTVAGDRSVIGERQLRTAAGVAVERRLAHR
jgi:hypothetical protein